MFYLIKCDKKKVHLNCWKADDNKRKSAVKVTFYFRLESKMFVVCREKGMDDNYF